MSDNGARPEMHVLDLSMGWAGPLTGQMLAEMGFEVIKVEDTRRFDWWRGSTSMAAAEQRPIERSAVFNTANRGKLGVTLDLTNPRGVAILKRMAEHADILIENFSPGVMERLGLSYDALRALNPRLIMISMPAFGYSGPEAGYRGYGNTIEGMSGVTALCRYAEDGTPYMMSNALGDPVSGLNGTLAVLAALYERERTQRGQWIELAEVETVISFLAAPLISYQLTQELPRPLGNRHPVHAPHGVYRCADEAGEERWVALSVTTEEQWRELLAVLTPLDSLTNDSRFLTMAQRKHNEDALEREISHATSSFNAEELALKLQEQGIAASPVNSAADMLSDRQLLARGFFVPIERAIVGTHLYPGAPVRLSATPLDPARPAPLLGEHNEQVMRELLKMNDEEIAALEADGIIGRMPRE